MKKSTKIGIGIAIGVIGGVAFYVYKQLSYAKKLCYSFSGVKIKEASISKVVFDMDYGIKNLDKLKIEIKGVSLDVFVDGKFTTKIKDSQSIKIEPFSKTVIPLNIVFYPKELSSDISSFDIGSLILGGGYKQIPIKFKGQIKLKKLGIVFSIPVSETYTIKQLSEGAGDSIC